MKVHFGNQNSIPKKPNYVKSAAKGAVLSTGIYSAFNTLASLSQRDMFEQVVKEVGGKKQYAKVFAVSLGVIATAGALLNVVATAISSKVQAKESPKAN